MIVLGEYHRLRLGDECVYLVVRILVIGENARELAQDAGRLEREGIVRHHGDAGVDEGGGYGSAFRTGTHQHGDVAVSGSRLSGIGDGFQHQGNLFVLGPETDADGALLGLFLHHHVLLDIGIEVFAPDLLGGELEEGVVEVHHGLAASPVFAHGFYFRAGEILLDLARKQGPVGIAPAVDALLHVSHDEVVVGVGIALVQQGTEIVPLYVGSVLELVQQEILVAHAHLFVNEGGVAAGDDVLEDFVGFVQHHGVLLGEHRLERAVELTRKTEAEAEVPQQPGGVVPSELFAEQVAEGRAFRFLGQRGSGCGDPVPYLVPLLVGRQLLDGICLAHHHVLCGGVHFRRETFYDAGAVLHQRGKVLLAEAVLELVPAAGLSHHQPAADFVELAFDAGPPALVQAVRDALAQPVQKVRAVCGERVEDAVHGLVYQGLLVEVYLVVGHLPDLPRKGLQGLLEELVDGGYRERAVVVEYVAEHLLLAGIGALVQELQDAALHLGRGLVGEGDGEYVPVCETLGKERQVAVCEGVCLA